VRPTLMAKTSNPALNSTRMHQTHYFHHILHAGKNYWYGRQEGVGLRDIARLFFC